MSGVIPPLPNTSSWRCAQLKHRGNFTFTLQPLHLQHTKYELKEQLFTWQLSLLHTVLLLYAIATGALYN